jgi:HD-GYP domain-containing protein (c-di-GMP phosphodiesterase class II)
MFVDPGILAAKEPLNLEEQRMIERHARRGGELIAERLPTLADIAEAISAHHERTDGTGYPAGALIGKLSPLARLLAVVDVYTALCSPRPQRPAHDPRTALTDTLLLADRGRLDRYAAEKLLTLGFYPAGTVVELSDGATAVVISHRDPRQAPHLAARPLLSLFTDGAGRPLPTPRTVDLAETDLGIVVRAVDPLDRVKRLGRHYPEWI